jgi:hypothetical protein
MTPPAILNLSSARLVLYEGSANEFEKFVLFTAEPELSASVLFEFNVSVVLNKSASYFLSDSYAYLINASIAKDGKLSVSCARVSWGEVLVSL